MPVTELVYINHGVEEPPSTGIHHSDLPSAIETNHIMSAGNGPGRFVFCFYLSTLSGSLLQVLAPIAYPFNVIQMALSTSNPSLRSSTD